MFLVNHTKAAVAGNTIDYRTPWQVSHDFFLDLH